MDIQSLGTKHCVQGSRLGVEFHITSPQQKVFPSTDSSTEVVCEGTAIKMCHKKNEKHQIPGASVLCPETGLRSKESYSGLVSSQQIYSLRQVPDAHYCAGADPTTPWGRHLLHRSYRRLLVYSKPSIIRTWIVRISANPNRNRTRHRLHSGPTFRNPKIK